MIKYVELTAPEASAFRQAKILSIECSEGDQIKIGQTLFRVKSGNNEIDLPATRDGRIVEIIASVHENITLSTALLLLETEVAGSTASTPIVQDNELSSVKAPPNDQNKLVSKEKVTSKQAVKTPVAQKPNSKPIKSKSNKSTSKAQTKQPPHKKHEQQTLDLLGDPIESSAQEPVKPSPKQVKLAKQQTPSNNRQPIVNQTMSSSIIQVTVPDIGADSAKVIEILVQVGDTVSVEAPLITLESDKASMDVPSTHSGTVKSIAVQLDQDISEGSIILELSTEATDSTTAAEPSTESAKPTPEPITPATAQPATSAPASATPNSGAPIDIVIPDIGGDSAKVIEILVNVGEQVELEAPLVTLESDKASMEVPSSAAGVIASIEVAIDQDVSEGTVVVTLTPDNPAVPAPAAAKAPAKATTTKEPVLNTPIKPTQQAAPASPAGKSHASPSIRRFARELGVDLSKVSGTGRKSRVTKDDVKAFVKGVINSGASSATVTGGSGIPPIPAQDFSKFGDIELQPLNKIKRLTASNLHRSWVNVPHVTHNDEANINDLESFRKQLNQEYKQQGKDTKLSPLAFIVKAVVNGLQKYPQFNSSLESGGENLILKKYFHIGIAVDTPNGLVVPVIRNADKKSVAEIGREMNELAAKARDKKLTMNDMSGACFTISSLGGIGGTGFTPIVNAPEVAILGVSRSKIQPVWNGSEFIPGMMLPLSLSYDHRVIDGAEAARFARHVAAVLEDVRRLTV